LVLPLGMRHLLVRERTVSVPFRGSQVTLVAVRESRTSFHFPECGTDASLCGVTPVLDFCVDRRVVIGPADFYH
jgi:hypothetical protein